MSPRGDRKGTKEWAREAADRAERATRRKASRQRVPPSADGGDDAPPDVTVEFSPKDLEPTLAEGGAAAIAALIEKAGATPGAVFERDTLAALTALAKADFPKWVNLRARLKSEARDVPVVELDKRIRPNGADSDGDDGLPGQPLAFDEIELWRERVDGAALLTELSDTIGEYLVINADQRDGVALWAVFAHAHDLRDYAPLLIAKSAIKRCGKSRLAEILERLSPRPLYLAGLTTSFIERAIDDWRCTLIIDEAGRIRKGDQALAERIDAQLNRSFKRQAARVGKNVPLPGGGYEPRLFSTWAPTFIAGIGDQADTAEDRAVIIVLKRKLRTQETKPLRGKDGADLVDLARKIARWVADNESRLRSHDPVPLEVDNDRAKDVWEPLLTIADIAGGEWPQRARIAGIALAGATEEEENLKVMLLGDIRDIFADEFPPGHAAHWEGPGRPDDGPRLASAVIIKRLLGLEDRPYSALGKAQKPLTQNMLGRQLKGFDIRPATVRVDGGGTAKGYYLRAFEDAFARYLPALEKGFEPTDPPTPPSHNHHTVTNPGKPGQSEDLQPSQKGEMLRMQNPGEANDSGICDAVTDAKGGYRDKEEDSGLYPDEPAKGDGDDYGAGRPRGGDGFV